MPISETHDKRVKHLLIHSYNDRIEERQIDRSMKNMKLVDLKERSLHSTENYVDTLKYIINVHEEMKNYLKMRILITPIDYPRQFNV